MRPAVKLFLLIVTLFLAGCGNSPPEIMNLHWQLNLTENDGEEEWISREELSLFVLAADEDGPDEVEFLYLIQEEDELFWLLSADNWESQTLGTDEWLGASSLRMSGNEPFPRKNYRVMVIDKSGQRSEQEFFLSAKTPDDPIFPAGKIEDGVLYLDSPHAVHTLRLYNSRDELVQELKTESREVNLETLLKDKDPGREEGSYKLLLFANLDSQGLTLRTIPILY